MTALLFDPHGDDAALFAAYTCLRHRPHVVVTYPTVPVNEIAEAFAMLQVPSTIDAGWPDWKPTMIYAPTAHVDGHEQHNAVADLVIHSFRGKDIPVCWYETYAPRGNRVQGHEVRAEPWMVARKLRALSCFVSQIEQESTRPWFTSLLDLREWVS